MFVPPPKAVGEIQERRGDFTYARLLRNKPAKRLEDDLGYKRGRLSGGYWVLYLLDLPTEDDFEFRGYTHLSGGRIMGHLPENAQAPTTEDMLREQGINLYGSPVVKKGLKTKMIENNFRVSGVNRIGKVVPINPPEKVDGEPDYPPGNGLPQWTLVNELRWAAADFVHGDCVFSKSVA